jgi:nicotinamide mononucleotide transporter
LATGVFELSVLLSGLLCVGLTAVGRREGYLFGLYNSITYSVYSSTDLTQQQVGNLQVVWGP